MKLHHLVKSRKSNWKYLQYEFENFDRKSIQQYRVIEWSKEILPVISIFGKILLI